eukprot:15477839-Alexandrium_andersonii.AAC.2
MRANTPAGTRTCAHGRTHALEHERNNNNMTGRKRSLFDVRSAERLCEGARSQHDARHIEDIQPSLGDAETTADPTGSISF